MKHINYLYPYWGSEHLSANDFITKAKDLGFQGIEINTPNSPVFEKQLIASLDTIRTTIPDFICVVQQVSEIKIETVDEYITSVLARFEQLIQFRPNFINSHTGKDHYSFNENCRIIEAIENFSYKNNIPVYHEIHRGRFTFHSATTLQYLLKFPELKLVGDLSHWCVVSESMLQGQDEILEKIIPHIQHIHARVGFEQGPQVNNPFAPEWKNKLKQFVIWWQRIIDEHRSNETITITPEFGPFPYMPQIPFSQEPMAQQYQLNDEMKSYLEHHLKM